MANKNRSLCWRWVCKPCLTQPFLPGCLQEHLCGTWENDGSIKQISNQRSVRTWHCPKMSGQLWRWFEWSSEAPVVPRTSFAATPSKTKIIKSNENEWGVICQNQRPFQVWIKLPPHFYFWKNQQKRTFCGKEILNQIDQDSGKRGYAYAYKCFKLMLSSWSFKSGFTLLSLMNPSIFAEG